MQVCIVGPGALGCLHAALLSRAGVTVSLLDYRPERARLIDEWGVIVEEGGAAEVVAVRCAADASDLPAADLLILCVKTFQTADAARRAAPLIRRNTALLRLQNGLASPDCLCELAPAERIVLGTSGHGADTVGWGHIRHAGTGPTRIGPLVPQGMAAAEQAAEVLRQALDDVEAVADAQVVLWQKLLVNAAVNPLTAITGLRNGQLLDVPLLRAALRDVAGEAEHVALAHRMPFTAGRAGLVAEDACRLTAANRSSMLQDVRAGRPTEIEDICGAVVREGEEAGIDAPLNRVLAWLVAEVLPKEVTKPRGSC